MSGFLQRVPLEEARRLLLEGIEPVGDELVAADDAAGRVAAAPVAARNPAPHYRASAMDGLALRSADTRGAGDAPVVLGRWSDAAAEPPHGEPWCLPVDTGAALPAWADAVLRIEDAAVVDGGYRIHAPVPPGRDVRPEGEDIAAGTRVLACGARIRPADVGALLSTGNPSVAVRRRPRVAILATGSEVVDPAVTVAGPGQVLDSTSRVLAAMVESAGGSAHRLGIVGDDEEALLRAIEDAAARFDALAVIAGSAGGRRDLTVTALSRAGQVLAHGIDIAPGRPAAIARLRRAPGSRLPRPFVPAIAFPGYPVASIVVAEQLLLPLLAQMLGRAADAPVTVPARVLRAVPSRIGIEEFRRVVLLQGSDGGSRVAALLPGGAGSLSSVTGAHGWLRIEAAAEGLDPGSQVDVELMVPLAEADAAFVLGGKPCAASVQLEDLLRRRDSRARVVHLRLAPADALRAVERGEAHGAFVAASASPELASGLEVLAIDGGQLLAVRASGSAHLRLRDALGATADQRGGNPA